MNIINTQFNKDYLSVPTESTISNLLIRDKNKINTNYQYVDINIGSCIKMLGIENTQKILNNYLLEENFFVCQHTDIDKLNFKNSKVFTPHTTKNDNYIAIPHYSLNSNNNFDISKRNILFSFKGSSSTFPLRKELINYYPENCFDTKVHWAVQSGFNKDDDANLKNSYKELIEKTWFSLCPRGFGISSIRLWEVMSMGSIPVILADDFKLPLEDKIDWKEFSISIKENEYKNIKSILNNIENKELMSKKVYDIYNEYFSNENLHKSIINSL